MGLRRLSKGQRGTAMVEAVMVIPVFMMILFGTVEFGLAFGRYQIVSHAARVGVREAILFRNSCTVGSARAEVEAAVRDIGTQLGMFPGDFAIDIQGLCTAGASRVEVTYRHNLIALPQVGLFPQPYIDLQAISVMRNQS